MESGGVTRRRPMLPVEKTDSPNLRDFLRIKENEDGHNSLSGLTLNAVLAGETRQSQVTRTLLDIIRDDPNTSKESKRTWKAFKDKLRLRRAGAAWTSTVPIPASDVPIQIANRLISRRNSTRFQSIDINSNDPRSESAHHPELASSSNSISGGDNRVELGEMLRLNSSLVSSLAANGYGRGGSMELNTGDVDEEEGAEEEFAEGEAAGRMSLMALLAEADRQMGMDGSTFIMDDDVEDEEGEEEQVVEEVSRGVEFNCCVCMVRHKGSAFIPCGHTFCRLCSRELWVQRGNCPLCNGFILEILDIF